MSHEPAGSSREVTGSNWLGRAGRPGAVLMIMAAGAGMLAAAAPATAAPAPAPAPAPANKFTQTNLVANSAAGGAKLVDSDLTNAWGLASAPGGPIWVSDNNSGDATVYSGGIKGSAVTKDLTVAVPGMNATGQVYNPDTSAFPVGGPTGSWADFIVSTDSIGATQSPGEIAAWNGGAAFTVEDSPTGGPGGMTPAGAVFKGLALATTPKAGPELFAADVHNATVDIFNSKFGLVSAPAEFKDPKIPAGYAPFGIQNLGNKIYVTYGKQNAAKTDVVKGAGLGYVDVYSVDGVLLHHLIAGGAGSPLNAPWGLAIAPKGFGPFAGDLLVGNLGNGWINAFNPTTGAYADWLDNNAGSPLVIKGLWGLQVGDTAFGGSSALVFSAGPSNYKNGLLGTITPG